MGFLISANLSARNQSAVNHHGLFDPLDNRRRTRCIEEIDKLLLFHCRNPNVLSRTTALKPYSAHLLNLSLKLVDLPLQLLILLLLLAALLLEHILQVAKSVLMSFVAVLQLLSEFLVFELNSAQLSGQIINNLAFLLNCLFEIGNSLFT